MSLCNITEYIKDEKRYRMRFWDKRPKEGATGVIKQVQIYTRLLWTAGGFILCDF